MPVLELCPFRLGNELGKLKFMSLAKINFHLLRRERQATGYIVIVLVVAVALILTAPFGVYAQDAKLSGNSGTRSIHEHVSNATENSGITPSKEENNLAGANASELEPRQELPHNLSPWCMFMSVGWVVKAVITVLALASLMTWIVWVAKTVEIALARTRLRRSLAVILSSTDLNSAVQSLAGHGGPAAFMVRSVEEELRSSHAALNHAGDTGMKERLALRLSRIETQAGRRLSKWTGVLATIGSAAPFVGLFGAIWGIINSFIGISESQTTNLAVVAPGIAEALLAIGLVAAIQAIVIYNLFTRAVTGYRQSLAAAATGVKQLVSLSLDFRKAPVAHEHDGIVPYQDWAWVAGCRKYLRSWRRRIGKAPREQRHTVHRRYCGCCSFSWSPYRWQPSIPMSLCRWQGQATNNTVRSCTPTSKMSRLRTSGLLKVMKLLHKVGLKITSPKGEPSALMTGGGEQ